MARYFIRLSYCGTAYNGWQSQPHKGTITIQSTIENALHTYLRKDIPITGCGRTDTGVHAKDYIAHFDFEPLDDIPTIIHRLNRILPDDIAIHDIYRVKDDAHARFNAISRSYQYRLHTNKSPFKPYSYFYFYDTPDLSVLNQTANLLLEYTDFTTFCKLHSGAKTMDCHLTESAWIKNGEDYTYKVTSDRFLRGMIRLIVGMCLQVARGKASLEEVKNALNHQDRLSQDWSVPAIGLMLCDIQYPDTIKWYES